MEVSMNSFEKPYPGSPPSGECNYPVVPGINYNDFVLGTEVMPAGRKQAALEQLTQ
jgi:hypothetical protein